jgi:hypothetical protein
MIAVAIGAFANLALLKKAGLNMASIATLGALATLVVQLLLASLPLGEGAYLALWHAGKLFGFLSTFGSGLMIASVAPADNAGFWNGLNMGLTNASVGLCQIIFSRIYDSNNDGSIEGRRGQTMLYTTSAISALAVLAYGVLIPVWPKEKDEKTEMKKAENYKDLDKWDKLSDREFAQLPMETIDAVNMAMVQEGRAPRLVSWGDYSQERPELSGLKDRALKDFNYITGYMRETLADRSKMIEMQKMSTEMSSIIPMVDREKAKAEMGAWIADYFDDAGYQDWEKMAPIYKSMLMNAFPPVDALDDAKPDYATMPIDKFEDALTKFLAVMDSHLATEKRRMYGKIPKNFMSSLVKRR